MTQLLKLLTASLVFAVSMDVSATGDQDRLRKLNERCADTEFYNKQDPGLCPESSPEAYRRSFSGSGDRDRGGDDFPKEKKSSKKPDRFDDFGPIEGSNDSGSSSRYDDYGSGSKKSSSVKARDLDDLDRDRNPPKSKSSSKKKSYDDFDIPSSTSTTKNDESSRKKSKDLYADEFNRN